MATANAVVDNALAKVTLTIQMSGSVTAVTVTRTNPDNTTDVIRSGANVKLTGGAATVDDYESPMDQPVFYTVKQLTPAGSEQAVSNRVTIASGGNTWLKDPVLPSRNVVLHVENVQETTRTARAGVFDIIDRTNPIVVAAKRQGWVGEVTVWTFTEAERQAMDLLLDRGAVLLFSTPPAYAINNVYVHVGDVTCTRLDTVGTEPIRRWTLPMTVVDRPSTLPVMPLALRWRDVKLTFASWNDLKATGMTWDQLMAYRPT